jgi:hypothetical protein
MVANRLFRRMYVPEHLGNSVSVSGVTLQVDDDRCIIAPESHVEQLLGHGLIDVEAEMERRDEQRRAEKKKAQQEVSAPEPVFKKKSKPRIERSVA